jgi:hypothetical protein
VAFVHFTGWIIADADFKANWRNQLGYNTNKNVSEKTPEPFVPDRGTIDMICLPGCLLQRGMRASSKERHLTNSSLQRCLKDRPYPWTVPNVLCHDASQHSRRNLRNRNGWEEGGQSWWFWNHFTSGTYLDSNVYLMLAFWHNLSYLMWILPSASFLVHCLWDQLHNFQFCLILLLLPLPSSTSLPV